MKNLNMPIDEYTPCRISECYLDLNGEIEAMGYTGRVFRLKGVGRIIWLMLDGKHTISKIVDRICAELALTDKKNIKKELLIILDMLNKKNAIVVNWDPIYKIQLSQELNFNE